MLPFVQSPTAHSSVPVAKQTHTVFCRYGNGCLKKGKGCKFTHKEEIPCMFAEKCNKGPACEFFHKERSAPVQAFNPFPIAPQQNPFCNPSQSNPFCTTPQANPFSGIVQHQPSHGYNPFETVSPSDELIQYLAKANALYSQINADRKLARELAEKYAKEDGFGNL